jgi:hypothetical protein
MVRKVCCNNQPYKEIASATLENIISLKVLVFFNFPLEQIKQLYMLNIVPIAIRKAEYVAKTKFIGLSDIIIMILAFFFYNWVL